MEGILPQHSLSQSANLKIKIEVDIVPHIAFETEELLRKAFSFNAKCVTLRGLFAGKMHAVLVPNSEQCYGLTERLGMVCEERGGDELSSSTQETAETCRTKKMTKQHVKKLLTARINSFNIERLKADALRFIPDTSKLAIG